MAYKSNWRYGDNSIHDCTFHIGWKSHRKLDLEKIQFLKTFFNETAKDNGFTIENQLYSEYFIVLTLKCCPFDVIEAINSLRKGSSSALIEKYFNRKGDTAPIYRRDFIITTNYDPKKFDEFLNEKN